MKIKNITLLTVLCSTLLYSVNIFSQVNKMRIPGGKFEGLVINETPAEVDLEESSGLEDGEEEPISMGNKYLCAEIKAANPQYPSGIYSVDIDGDGENYGLQDVYCDMDGGWTLLYDFGSGGDKEHSLIGSIWQLRGTDISRNHPAYPTSPEYTQYYGSGPEDQAFMSVYLDPVFNEIKFVELAERDKFEDNYGRYTDKTTGLKVEVDSYPINDGAGAEMIMNISNADTSKFIQYAERKGIVFLDAAWVR